MFKSINFFWRISNLRLFLGSIALFFFSGGLLAGNVNLAWNPSISSNVGGYKLFWGSASNNYSASIDVGNVTTYQLSGLNDGATYFFALKAYDTAKTIESAFSNEISATIPPSSTTLSADFTANKTSGTAPLIVSFSPSSSAGVTGFNWNFGDSSIPLSTSQYSTVTYSTPGTYTVSLTVTGSTDSVTETKVGFITVSAPPPTANFSASSTSGTAPLTVNFSDTSTGSITGRTWDFGDGSTSTDINPSHTYILAGVYSVSLTVTGPDGGNTKTNTNFINVSSSGGPSSTNNNGLVAAFGFEEDSGSMVADASGQGNHGTIKEAVRIRKGRFGKALQFDGVNDWVTVNGAASLDLSSGMTLEAWVYPQSLAGWNNVLLKETSGGLVYGLYANSDAKGPSSYINNGGDRDATSATSLVLNQWTHLVGTYDGQVQRLYVNGVEVTNSSLSGLIDQSSGVLRIGGNSVWGEYFKGYIDEVRIYNRALSAAEINTDLATAISISNPPKYVMGNQNEEPWVDYRPQGTAEAFRTIAEQSGVVTNVLVYLDSTSTTTQVVVGIYNDNNGHPGNRLTRATASSLKLGAWNSISIPTVEVTAGQSYWIAILGAKGQIGILDQVGSSNGVMETSKSKTLTTLPSTWSGTSTKTNSAMSLFGSGYR